MPFKKGESGNPKGRPKGVGNKLGISLKIKIANVLDNILDEIESKWDDIALAEKVQLLSRLAPFVVAKMTEKKRVISYKDLTEEEAQEVINDMLAKLEENDK